VTSNATGTGQWLGSVDYVAPETLVGHPADARSDLYALGCVRFELWLPFRPSIATRCWPRYGPISATPPFRLRSATGLPVQVDAVLIWRVVCQPGVR